MIESPLQALYRRLLKPPFWRLRDAQARALPDFLLIGAMRSGTTTLYDLVCGHPRVLPAIKKEIHFFDLYFGRGLPWYRAHFPRTSRLRTLDGRTGEASPYYLAHPRAPERAAAAVPDAKLLVVLRDPVERAYSHYWHAVRLGIEDLPFEEALAAEAGRLAGEVERMRADPAYYSRAHHHLGYLDRSQYVDQVAAWLDHFPRARLLVLSQRDLRTEPGRQLARVFDFLGLPPAAVGSGRHMNRATYPPLDPALRSRLADHFRPYNERLFSLLGERFDWAA